MIWTRHRIVGALAAAGTLSVAALATASATTRYEGKVRNAGPVSFRVSSGSVKRFQASMTVSCVSVAPARSAIEIYVIAPDASAKLGRNSQFTFKLNKPKQQFRDKSGKVLQTLYSVKATVEGKVPGRSASGTAKVSYNKFWAAYNPGTGYYVFTSASCFSGKAKTPWTARRK